MKHFLAKIFPLLLFIASISLLGFTFLNFNSSTELNQVAVASAQTAWSKGNPEAPVTIYAYEDFECPYCQLSQPVIDELIEKHGDQVQVVYRHFPIAQIHPNAMLAAHAAEAAGAQGKFWEMHNLLFANQANLSKQLVRSLAQELQLDMDTFDREFNSQAIRDKINREMEMGKDAGVYSTPSFVINGQVLPGVQAIEDFEMYLN